MSSRILRPEWFVWSSGEAMSAEDRASMRRLMAKSRLRVPGETTRQRFRRLREILQWGHRSGLVRDVGMDEEARNA